MSSYLIPKRLHRADETIRRSRFIATIGHSPESGDAKDFVARIREEFSDATHNCWAYVAGPPGSTARVGMSDDGEPHGTAGRPLLNVLLHSGIGEIVVVVTRYFGGIRLGTGGLVRAYSGVAQKALSTLEVRRKIIPAYVSVIVDYANADAVRRMAVSSDAKITGETYEADVSFVFEVPKEKADAFQLALTNLTHGELLIEKRF